MADRNLNHLMAEAIGWETADPNGVATWFDAEGKFTGYLTRKPADTKHPLYDLPIWQPETDRGQAMRVLDGLIEKYEEFWCAIHNRVSEKRVWEVALGLTLEQDVCAHSTDAAEAICLAVEAALKEGKNETE